MKFTPITLEGNFVRLEPLSIHHKQGLCDAIRDVELWNLFVTIVPHPDAIDAFFANAQITLENNEGMAFATIDKATNKIAGSTRFMKSNLPNKRAEIGFTFLVSAKFNCRS